MATTKPTTTLFASVRDLIRDRDEIEKALPLDEPKFRQVAGEEETETTCVISSSLMKFVSQEKATTETNDTSGTGFKRRI
jgi:hypothetical protein